MRQSKGKKNISRALNDKIEEPIANQLNEKWVQRKINIVVLNEEQMESVPKILVNFNTYFDEGSNIVAFTLLEYLRNQLILSPEASISYYLPSKDYFVFAMIVPTVNQPIDRQAIIEPRFLENNSTLKIKARNKKRINIEELIEEQREKYEEAEDEKNNKPQREKKICEVVQKVALWRKFYTGFYDESGTYHQRQLDVAAQEVGIAKKTLDDYLLQIRNGKKYGFNFNQKFNERIGELRSFVRDEKKKQSGKPSD